MIRRCLRRAAGAALTLALASILGCSSAAPRPETGTREPVLELREGATVTGVVHPGDPHVFPLMIEAGTYFEIHLDRPPNELGAYVFEPSVPADAEPEAALRQGEPSSDSAGGQLVWEVASTAGDHLLRVEAGAERAVPYRLTLTGLHPADEAEWSRHRGLQVYGEAVQVGNDGEQEEALDRFLEARRLFERGGYQRGVALTCNRRGGILESMRRWDEARAEYLSANALWSREGDPGSEAVSLFNLARLERETARWDEAEKYLDEVLALAREWGAPTIKANALLHFCGLYSEEGQYDRAIEVCQEAVRLKNELDRPDETVYALVSLGDVHRFRGELDAARTYLLRAQDVLEEYPDPWLAATVQNNLAILFNLEGNYLEALGYYQRALNIYEELGAVSFAGTVLSNMGTVYQRLGDHDATLEYYRQALRRMEEAGEYFGRAHVLHGLGWVHVQNGQLEEADAFLSEALEIARASESPPLVAASLEKMGELHLASGRPREAIASLEEALALYQSSGSRWREPSILVQLAKAHTAIGDQEHALELLFDAASGYEDIGRRSGVAESYHQIAEVERDRGDLQAARHAVEQAVAVADALRPQVGSEGFRTLFSATTRPYYELYVNILMEQHRQRPNGGHDAEALRESERARARSLLEILPESSLDLADEVDEELLVDKAAIRQRLNTKELERQSLLKSHSPDPGDLFRVKLDLEALLTDLQEVERKIRAASPRYAALTRPEPVSVGEIQRSILSSDTALLEYLLGEDRSYLWVVTDRSFRSYELPRRQEIEARARCVHWLITAYGSPPASDQLDPEGIRCLGDSLAAYRSMPPGSHVLRVRAHRRQSVRQAFDDLAGELSSILLGPPARDGLLPFRLAVIPDGALEYVPFAALPSPHSADRPLVLEHELLRLPSASVLAFQRTQPPPPNQPAGDLAIVADPVYSLSDVRLTGLARPRARSADDSSAAHREATAVPQFTRLDFSGHEASAIAELAPSSRTLLLDGFDASHAAVDDGVLSGFRYLHFATHGVIDTEYPQLSSLVLSLVNRDGEPDESGYLRLHDIYGLDLDDTDMVVLSACETALGREVRGEGLVGLTRGFLYAGAERVVASLWQVQDRATADLMERMYRGLLEEGRSPSDALRRAQIETRDAADGRYAFPYYWAGFVLQGEWR